MLYRMYDVRHYLIIFYRNDIGWNLRHTLYILIVIYKNRYYLHICDSYDSSIRNS